MRFRFAKVVVPILIVIALLTISNSAFAQTAIAIGDVINGSLDVNGEEDVYTFSGTAGQIVIFDDQTSPCCTFRWKLVSPAAVIVFDEGLSNDKELTLAANGTYTLTVYGATGTSTGAYQFQLWPETTDNRGAITIDNQNPTQGDLSVPGEVDVYTFAGTAGQIMIFDDQTSPCCTFRWKLVSPTDVIVFDEGLSNDKELTLATNGTYTLSVYRASATSTGIYQFQLWTETTDNRGAITIDNQNPTQGDLSKPGELDVYTFAGTAGEIVIFDDQTSPCCTFRWKLVSPTAVVVFDEGLSNDREYTLTATGTYTITVYRASATSTGIYQFQLWTETTDDRGTITVDNLNPTQGTLSKPGEHDLYTLNMVSGQTLVLDDQTSPCCDFRWKLENPGGGVIFDEGLNTDKTLSVTTTGAYKLTVYRACPTCTGTYQFLVTLNPLDLQPTPDPTDEPTPNPTDEPTPDPTDEPGPNDPEPDPNNIQPSGTIGSGNVTDTIGNPFYTWIAIQGATSYDLYLAPSNNLLLSLFYGTLQAGQYCAGNVCSVDLTGLSPLAWLSNGTYSLFMKANNGDWKGPFNFNVNVPKPTVVTLMGYDTNTPKNTQVALLFDLQGNAAYSAFFYVYAAPSNDLLSPVIDQWYSRKDLSCETDTTCSLLTPDLQSGVRYEAYIQSWGPGGITEAGGIANTGFAGALYFGLGGQLAATPQNIAATKNGTQVTITWSDDVNAAKYQIFVGDLNQLGSPDDYYFQTIDKTGGSISCDGATCTLTVDMTGKPNGTYSIYMQAQNAGNVPSDWAISKNAFTLP